MPALYNEIEPYAVEWLRNLERRGDIAPGAVDARSVRDLAPDDVRDVAQFHAFAGIGVWSHALRLAGWPDELPVWTGSCPCFPAGTLVLTRRGYLPIEAVIVGDEVLTHRARWRTVQAVGSEEANLIRVRGQGHWGLLTTSNHPFLTGLEEWTPARNLAGKRWRTVAKVPTSDIPAIGNGRGVMFDRNRWRATGWKNGRSVYLGRYCTEAEAVTRRRRAQRDGEIDVRGADGSDPATLGFARFLGYWVGDGWTSGDSVHLCGALSDGPLLHEIMFGAGLSCSLSMERTGARGRCGSRDLVRWLNTHFGSTAAGKSLPAWLHGTTLEWRNAFLDGYWQADGHDGPGVRQFTTTSRALAVGVRVLLNQKGVSASILWHRTSSERHIKGRSVKTAGGFYRVSAYQRSRSFKFGGAHGIGYVRTVETAGRERVFNLAVSEDESYTADGVVVHNCQPFSVAGRRRGTSDERHLWPEWFRLIRECRPNVVFGEQVASPAGRTWFDAVSADLEGVGYAVGAADLCAASAGAPHIRQRLYFVAHLSSAGRVGDTGSTRLEGRQGERGDHATEQPAAERASGGIANFWSDAEWIPCLDGKARPVEPGTFPLAHGHSGRVAVVRARESTGASVQETHWYNRRGALQGIGNAIVAQVAATFVRAAMAALNVKTP